MVPSTLYHVAFSEPFVCILGILHLIIGYARAEVIEVSVGS
jgi:hypothetical protein